MIGLITPGMKQTGKRSAGKPHAAFDVAGAGNVTMVAGLRSLAKARELPPAPTVRAPALDPTCERLGVKLPGATLPPGTTKSLPKAGFARRRFGVKPEFLPATPAFPSINSTGLRGVVAREIYRRSFRAVPVAGKLTYNCGRRYRWVAIRSFKGLLHDTVSPSPTSRSRNIANLLCHRKSQYRWGAKSTRSISSSAPGADRRFIHCGQHLHGICSGGS
jgi:hypothetical protein